MNNISYALCETVADLMAFFVEEQTLPDDSRETVRLTIEWAEEFETRHAGEQWIDREYLEEIQHFFEEKYRGWQEAASPRFVRIVQ
jgi:hypothetical protein